jgi:adenine deaminase
MALDDRIAAARGDKQADLVLANARIINVFNGQIENGNVAVHEGWIVGVGDYTDAGQVIDLKGDYLAPGLIDGHTHVESSMLHPVRYAEAVVPRGTLSLVTDLHEIANVCGLDGIRFILKWARRLPLDMFVMAPPCVPATHMETSGAELNAEEIARISRWEGVIGLGEVMNFPGVIGGDPGMLAKIKVMAARAVDGHSPGVRGNGLNAYLTAGVGSDHECTQLEEAREKLARGMFVMIREGSSEKNLEALLPLVNDHTWRRCMFVVDDRSCADLLSEGDIDAVVRKAIARGLEPVRAIAMATLNTAEYFRLHDRGGIAPGRVANLMTLSDLRGLQVDRVFHRGQLVARGGRMVAPLPKVGGREMTGTVKVKPFGVEALALRVKHEDCNVIEIVPGQIVTRRAIEKMVVRAGAVEADPGRDILKLVVVERHRATGNIGIGLVKGFGLKRGALASSVAHDSHNIVAVGANDADIRAAVMEVVRMEGGLTACAEGDVLASLPLPVAGLLSPEQLEAVVGRFEVVEKAAAGLGSLPPSPFALLSFLALPVIPELKLTDRGLVDVAAFKLIEV